MSLRKRQRDVKNNVENDLMELANDCKDGETNVNAQLHSDYDSITESEPIAVEFSEISSGIFLSVLESQFLEDGKRKTIS